MYDLYLLIDESHTKTYIGFSDRLSERIKEHKRGITKTTKNFGKFRVFRLESVEKLNDARKREKYWKSATGRKKLKKYYAAIV